MKPRTHVRAGQRRSIARFTENFRGARWAAAISYRALSLILPVAVVALLGLAVLDAHTSTHVAGHLGAPHFLFAGVVGGELLDKLTSFGDAFESFKTKQNERLFAIEQRLGAPTGGPGGPGNPSPGLKAPIDPVLRTPILSKEHKLIDNLVPLPGGGERPKLDFGKWLKGAVTGNWDGAPEERKALTTAGTDGALVVPDILGAEIIDLARANIVCIAAGARTVPLSTGKATLPTLLSDVVGAWQQGENVDIATTTPEIGPTDVVTHTLACYIEKVPVQLFEDATSLLGAMLSDAFIRSFATKLDGAALRGAGGNYEPLGLLANSGVAKSEIDATLTADNIASAIAEIKNRNYIPGAYILDGVSEKILDTAKASTGGQYLGLPASVEALQRLVTSAAGVNVFVGDFSKLVFFVRTPINLELSRTGDGGAWKSLSISIRAYMRVDVVATNPGAFQALETSGS
jgi:HK97 family phage major capsid protein